MTAQPSPPHVTRTGAEEDYVRSGGRAVPCSPYSVPVWPRAQGPGPRPRHPVCLGAHEPICMLASLLGQVPTPTAAFATTTLHRAGRQAGHRAGPASIARALPHIGTLLSKLTFA